VDECPLTSKITYSIIRTTVDKISQL